MMHHHPLKKEILVFKTNICFAGDIAKVAECLQSFNEIIHWNVDLEDVDKVLRIETIALPATSIIQKINECGYICDELPD